MSLRIGDFEATAALGWSGADLLHRLIALDYEVLAHLTAPEEGDVDQWAPVFMLHPPTWRMILDERDKVVGYWHFAVLRPDVYRTAVEGRLLDSQITTDALLPLTQEGRYDIYFTAVCVTPARRGARASGLLFGALADVAVTLAAQGIFFARVCGNAYTPEGVRLCRKLGLSRSRPHKSARGEIYEGDFRDIAARFPRRWRASLLEAYERRPSA
jgi:hypothetical protein